MAGVLGVITLAFVVGAGSAGAHGDDGLMKIEPTAGAQPLVVDVVVTIIYANDREPAEGASVSVDAIDSAGATTGPATLVDAGDGRYTGPVELPREGAWTLRASSTNPAASGELAITVTAATSPTTDAENDDGGSAEAPDQPGADESDDGGEDSSLVDSVLVIGGLALIVGAATLIAQALLRRRQGPPPGNAPSS